MLSFIANTGSQLGSSFRHRWVMVLFGVAALGYGVSSWMAQLTLYERQFVGDWTTTETSPDGSTTVQRLTLRSNRTGHIHHIFNQVAAPGRPARNQEWDTNLRWAIREDRLWYDSVSIGSGNVIDFSNRALHRLRNRVFRTNCSCDHYGVFYGRLSQVGLDTFSVHQLTPDFGGEYETLDYSRVASEWKP